MVFNNKFFLIEYCVVSILFYHAGIPKTLFIMDYNSLIYSAKKKKNEAMPQANRHTPTDCKRVKR